MSCLGFRDSGLGFRRVAWGLGNKFPPGIARVWLFSDLRLRAYTRA